MSLFKRGTMQRLPAPDPLRTMAVSVWSQGQAVTKATGVLLTDGGNITATNIGGRLVFDLRDLPYGWTRTVLVEAPGFFGRSFDLTLTTSCDVTLSPIPVKPTYPVPRPIHPEGRYLIDDTGACVPIRSTDCMLGILRHSVGEDMRPFMRWARDVTGANSLRAFGSMFFTPTANNLPPLTPDITLAHLGSFLSMAGDEGLRVDLSLGDGQVFFHTDAERLAFVHDVWAIMNAHPNGYGPLSLNEPWKNGFDATRDLDALTGKVLRARGSAEDENSWYTPPLELTAQHTLRSLEEGGYKWVRHQYEQWQAPGRVYLEEPMGCGEAQIDGRRDNNPEAFRQAAAVGELVGCGWNFHVECGMLAQIPPPDSQQQKCAIAVGEARRWLRPELQRGQVTRTGLTNILKLDDDHAERCILRIAGDRAQVVAVRPFKGGTRYVPEAQNGWRIESQSADGALIDMVRG
jgi:hypothetical protein